jgi:peptidoglycan/LPS O-acetylase OafA/YrhL
VTLTTLAPPAKETTSGSTAAPRSGGRGGRIAVIDGLRLLAAVAVAFYHFSGSERVGEAWGGTTSHLFPTLGRFSAYGFLGVELFFMISGFVICMSAWGRPLGDFARSRITRLFPAYWPAVLITTAVVALWPVATTRLPADQADVRDMGVSRHLISLGGVNGSAGAASDPWSRRTGSGNPAAPADRSCPSRGD